MEKDIRARMILHTDQNEVWVYSNYEGLNKLTLYDEHFVEKKTLSLNDITLSDIALTSSQDIIATETGYCKQGLVKISTWGKRNTIGLNRISTLCSTSSLLPWGICINNRQQIIVGLQAGWRKYPIKLVIYSPDGSTVLREIETPAFRSGITNMKQNGNGDYLVADFYSLRCIGSKGGYKWGYHLEGIASVSGIACDKYNNIIIAEYRNDKISLLSSKGKLVTILLTQEDGIRNPRSLSIDKYGQLWIGQDHSLKVVKYLI